MTGTISVDDQAIIRRRAHSIDPLYLCVFPKQVVATALVNGTPTWTDPVANLTVDNTSAGWTDTERGQYFEVTRSGVLIYSGCIRSVPDSTTLPIAAIRIGDTGFAQSFMDDIQDNDVVTVYSARIPFAVLSYIDDDLELNKRFGIPFNASRPQSRYLEPHARFGKHRHSRVAEGDEASLTFVDNSVDFYGDALTRLWRPPSAWTQTTGTDTSATAIYDVPAGNYILAMTAQRTPHDYSTDSALGFRYVFVTDGPAGDNPAFSDQFVFTVESDEQDRVGRTVTYRVLVNPDDQATFLSYMYPGAFCLFQETPRFSSDNWATEGTPSDGIIDTFCGHLRQYEEISVDETGVQTWRVTFQSWLTYCAALPIPSQEFHATDTPAAWYEVYTSNSRIDAIIYMVLFYHTEMARLYDFFLEDVESFEVPYLSFLAGSLLGAMQSIMERVTGGNIGCSSSGELYARRHLSYESDAYRAALDVVMIWYALDWKRRLGASIQPNLRIGNLLGAGIVSGTTNPPAAYLGQSGYKAQSQGVDTGQELPGFVAADEADVYARIGHAYANMNRPITHIPGEALGNRDTMDPATMEPHQLSLDSYIPIFSTELSTTRRVIPLTVSRSYVPSPAGTVKRISFTVEPETKGKPAIAVPTTDDTPGIVFVPPDEEEPPTDPDDPCALDHGYDWCSFVDYRVSQYSAAITLGTYTAGVGIEDALESIGGGVTKRRGVVFLGGLNLNSGDSPLRCDLVYTLTKGTINPTSVNMRYFQRDTGYGYVYIDTDAALSDGTELVRTTTAAMTVPTMGVNWRFIFYCSSHSGGYAVKPDPGGSLTIIGVVFYGNGTKPSALP